MLALLGAAACGNEADDGAAVHLDSLDPLTAVEEVRVGSLEDPVAGFSDIRALTVGDDGLLRVLDADARQVRVFTPAGEWLRSIGGPGQGPGEFERPSAMGLLGDTLWVHDLNAFRISWFDPEGEVLFTTPGAGVTIETAGGRSVRVVPYHPREDGTIESTAILPSISSADSIPVLRFSRNGSVLDTLRWRKIEPSRTESVSVGGRDLNVPTLRPTSPIVDFDGRDSVVVSWAANSDGVGMLRITLIGPGADTLATREFLYDGVPTTDEVADSLIAGPVEVLPLVLGLPEDQLRRELRAAVDIPPFRPPVRRLHRGIDGSMLIELNTTELDSASWLVLDPDGSARGRVTLPADVEPEHLDGSVIWAVDPDELEVPWLVRLRMSAR